jgi:hypothetical protein
MAEQAIPKDWLQERATAAEAEAHHTSPEWPVPFGALNAEWEQMLTQMQPGDELWSFASPRESWEQLAGRAGYALVRDGVAIAVLVTMMN